MINKSKILCGTALAAAVLMLAGCGNVDVPLEKKNVVTTTTTGFTFLTTTKESTTTSVTSLPAPKNTEKTTTTPIPVTTTKRISTTAPATTTPLTTTTTTTTTTPAPTTTTASTQSTTTTTTTGMINTVRSTLNTDDLYKFEDDSSFETEPVTEPTSTYANPDFPDINNNDMQTTANIIYNEVELGVGDSFASIQELLGDPTAEPTGAVSQISKTDVTVYHYSALDIEVSEDTITGIIISGVPISEELEPRMTTDIRIGSGIDRVFDKYGSGSKTDETSLMFSDGYIKMIISLPGNAVSKIVIGFV